jgi:hypothetical protein
MATKRSGPGLIDIPADRLKPRVIGEPANPQKPTRGSGSGGRAGKTMIGAYLDKADLYIVQELLLRLSRERGSRVTMQDAIIEGLCDYCAKYGVTLTSGGGSTA